MAKLSTSKVNSRKAGWVIRSAKDGKIITHAASKQEAEARARFLAVASLSAVPKKSNLTKAQAQKAVAEFLRNHSDQAAEA